MLAAAVFGLGSMPVAMHYLSKDQFGLWTLMSSIGMYLSLVDLGMSSSIARLLVDHKDDREKGAYGGLVLTGWAVLLVQGALVCLAGCAIAPVLMHLLKKIPLELQGDFVTLMRWQSASLGLAFATRIASHLLNAHQRIDVFNYSQLTNLCVQFASLCWFFHAGEGVYSLAWASLAGIVSGALVCFGACWRLSLFPARGRWGRPSAAVFRGVFAFGADMFLVAVGTQLILASQGLIITRCVGLDAAGAWNVGTRAYNLVSQALWRVFDFSAPALSEMIVRRERGLLRERFKGLVILSAALSGVAAVLFTLCNSTFVSVLSHGKYTWPVLDDVLLAVWMVVLAILHCHCAFVLLTKEIRFMRYVYFLEGLVFVGSALICAPRWGLPAVIVCSVVCSTLFSGAYGVWRMSRYFSFPVREIALEWQAPMARVLLWLAPAGLVWWFAAERFAPALVSSLPRIGGVDPVVAAWCVRLALTALCAGGLGGYLFLRLGLPQNLQRELIRRVPGRFTGVLRRVFSLQPA